MSILDHFWPFVLAAWALTHIIRVSRIAEGLRTALRPVAFAREMLDCALCTGFWCSLALSLAATAAALVGAGDGWAFVRIAILNLTFGPLMGAIGAYVGDYVSIIIEGVPALVDAAQRAFAAVRDWLASEPEDEQPEQP